MHWLAASCFSLLSFGLWGFFSKLAVDYLDANSALLYQSLGIILVSIVALSFIHFKPVTSIKGLSYAILTGSAYSIGCFFYFIAASKGRVVAVVTLTALYPLITILLACFFLKEAISIKQCMGIALALAAILLMAT